MNIKIIASSPPPTLPPTDEVSGPSASGEVGILINVNKYQNIQHCIIYKYSMATYSWHKVGGLKTTFCRVTSNFTSLTMFEIIAHLL